MQILAIFGTVASIVMLGIMFLTASGMIIKALDSCTTALTEPNISTLLTVVVNSLSMFILYIVACIKLAKPIYLLILL